MDAAHDHLVGMLSRLKLTAIRDQLDSLIDEAGRRELTIREALALFCVGKTHLAVALGREAITAGYTVMFVSAPALVAQLVSGR